MKRTLMLIPASASVGLKTSCFGMQQFFANNGLLAGIFKPIQQNDFTTKKSKYSISLSSAMKLYSDGKSDVLLEKVLENFTKFSTKYEIIIVQGLYVEQENQCTQQLNKKVASALSAELVIVASPNNKTLKQMHANIDSTTRFFSNRGSNNIIACIVNKINSPLNISNSTQSKIINKIETAQKNIKINLSNRIPVIAKVPWHSEMLRPRVIDIIPKLNAKIINPGNINQARIVNITMCARSVDNISSALRPGNLIITAGDRSDIILATTLAVANGCKIAGLLLTGGYEPKKELLELCQNSIAENLVILVTEFDSFTTTQLLQNLEMHIHDNDTEQQKLAGEYIANCISKKWLKLWLAENYKPRLTPAAFCYQLSLKAQANLKRILLPEASDPRIIEAAIIAAQKNLALPILLGELSEIEKIANNAGYSLPKNLLVINPVDIREKYIKPLVALREHKGMTTHIAAEQLSDNIVLATMMLQQGAADGLVAGAITTTANTIRPALQLIKTNDKNDIVSSIFFMCLPQQVMVYGDCAINPNPNTKQLAQIAIASAKSAAHFGIEPKIAMISYATGNSGSGDVVKKVADATNLVKESASNFVVDGPLQYDAAINPDVAAKKAPTSDVAGQATVCIFPDLNTGNTTYKAVQRSADVMCIGPMLQGLNKPVNDLSRGASIDDIIFTIVITAIQAQTNHK